MPSRPRRGERRPDALGRRAVLMRGRLVDEQQARAAARAPARRRRAAAGRSRSRPDSGLRKLVERRAARAVSASLPHRPRRAGSSTFSAHRQLRHQPEALRDVRELAPTRARSSPPIVPASGSLPAAEQHQQRRLARARAADDHGQLARAQLERRRRRPRGLRRRTSDRPVGASTTCLGSRGAGGASVRRRRRRSAARELDHVVGDRRAPPDRASRRRRSRRGGRGRDRREHALRALAVELGRRLVDDDERRAARKRDGERRARELTARELGGARAEAVRDPERSNASRRASSGRCSAIVRCGKRLSAARCETYAPRRAESGEALRRPQARRARRPPTTTRPSVGASSPASRRSSVDLPLPETPTSAVIAPPRDLGVDGVRARRPRRPRRHSAC